MILINLMRLGNLTITILLVIVSNVGKNFFSKALQFLLNYYIISSISIVLNISIVEINIYLSL